LPHKQLRACRDLERGAAKERARDDTKRRDSGSGKAVGEKERRRDSRGGDRVRERSRSRSRSRNRKRSRSPRDAKKSKR